MVPLPFRPPQPLEANTDAADGGKLILQSYFESKDPKPPMYGSVLAHPLLETLIARDITKQRLREHIIEIIESTDLREKTRGRTGLQKAYMGKLMKRLRGKLDVGVAKEVLKDEMERRLDFTPEGSWFSVRVRSREEVDRLVAEEGKERGE